MIYKDFVAEAAQKIMAECLKHEGAHDWRLTEQSIERHALNSVYAAKMLAEVLENDFNNTEPDGGQRKFSDKETFFDNYVNWTKNI